jgi:hypothetical protein
MSFMHLPFYPATPGTCLYHYSQRFVLPLGELQINESHRIYSVFVKNAESEVKHSSTYSGLPSVSFLEVKMPFRI